MGQVLRKEQCPVCKSMGGDSSKDNRVVYQDGSYYCFSCADVKPSNEESSVEEMKPLKYGLVYELPDRKLEIKTCEKYGVKCSGREIIFPIYDGGKEVKQKIRNRDNKDIQYAVGEGKSLRMFGQHIFNPSKSIPIVVTEGEYDAMAVYQATGYPAISVTRGSKGAIKELQANMEWLGGWKHITLAFDNDEAGQKAVEECLGLFEPGQIRIATFPLKDANDMLLAGREEEIKKCLFNATIIKPATLVTPVDIRARVLERPQMGGDWPWNTMTKATYGARWGEVYLLAGATSVGKTEFMREIITTMIQNGTHVGIFSLEQDPADTLRRYIGSTVNKRIHIPGGSWWDEEEINKQLDYLEDKVALYDSASGELSIDQIIINMRYLNKCSGTKFFIIDNLKALSVRPMMEGKVVPDFVYQAHCMNRFFLLAKELKVTIFVLTHVGKHTVNMSAKVTALDGDWDAAKALDKEGTSWQSGRMPALEHIYGGTSVFDLTDYVIAIARNRVSEDEIKHRTINVKFLKTRLDSAFEGKQFSLIYDYESGRLKEVEDLI